MTPGARISAVIELLDKIDRSYSQAEEVVASYMRGRRYIGAKDRRFVSETVYSMLRHTAHLNWWTRAGSSRDKMIAYLAKIESMTLHDLRQIFDGLNYSPPPLNPTEMGTIPTKSDKPTTDSDLPTWVQAEFPEWLYTGMASYWNENFIAEAQALNMRAPVDLKVGKIAEVLLKHNLASVLGNLEKVIDFIVNAASQRFSVAEVVSQDLSTLLLPLPPGYFDFKSDTLCIFGDACHTVLQRSS